MSYFGEICSAVSDLYRNRYFLHWTKSNITYPKTTLTHHLSMQSVSFVCVFWGGKNLSDYNRFVTEQEILDPALTTIAQYKCLLLLILYTVLESTPCSSVNIYQLLIFWFCSQITLLNESRDGWCGFQWWKSRTLVWTIAMLFSSHASMTLWSFVDPAGLAMYDTPLCKTWF